LFGVVVIVVVVVGAVVVVDQKTNVASRMPLYIYIHTCIHIYIYIYIYTNRLYPDIGVYPDDTGVLCTSEGTSRGGRVFSLQ
jgi:hypothetical protein